MRELIFRGQTRRTGEKIWFNGEKVPGNWVYGGICHGRGDFSVMYGYVDGEQSSINKFVVYTDIMKYPYYEVCIGPGPFLPGDDSSFWMCIHGVRQPTPAEAEQFLAEDVKTYGGKVLAVNPISAEEASAFYDLSMEEKWPVFGEEVVS